MFPSLALTGRSRTLLRFAKGTTWGRAAALSTRPSFPPCGGSRPMPTPMPTEGEEKGGDFAWLSSSSLLPLLKSLGMDLSRDFFGLLLLDMRGCSICQCCYTDFSLSFFFLPLESIHAIYYMVEQKLHKCYPIVKQQLSISPDWFILGPIKPSSRLNVRQVGTNTHSQRTFTFLFLSQSCLSFSRYITAFDSHTYYMPFLVSRWG